jgi:hypothetical protein
MKIRILFPTLSALVLCTVLPGAGRAELKQIVTVRLHSQIHIDASSRAIWNYATRGSNFDEWMPMWDLPRNARINLVAVGNWLRFVDDWNNKGRSVVTYISRNKEVRLTNDPEDGSFMYQVKLILDLDGQGTLVHLYEQYTDESTPTEFSAAAQKVQVSMDRALKSLKTEVERRARGAAAAGGAR